MLNKIFLGVFAAAVIGMSILTFYAHRQLQSIGFKPEVIAENFSGADALNWNFLWFSTLALFVLANVVLWTSRRAWALWLTLGYFAVFTLIETWWLGGLFSTYERTNNLTSAGSIGSYVFGAVLCILAAIVVFFSQFLIVRLRDRIHPTAPPETAAAAANDASPSENL